MPNPTPPKNLIPELGAIAGDPPSNGLPAQPVGGPAPWGALDASVAPNFVSAQPVVLTAGTVLRRVFGYPDSADPWPSWETGAWWTRQPLPATEADWRGQYAVEAQWNGGQCVVAWTIPQDLHGWAGPATLQAGEYADGEPAPGYYLPGGGEQIYIAPEQLPIGTWAPGSTPWAPVPASTTATATTAKPAIAAPAVAATVPASVTVGTLAAAVAHLAAVVQAMAKEAKTKGVDGGPLKFQAVQLTKIEARLARYNTATTAPHLRAVVSGLIGISRHVHTSYAWSAQSSAAADALREVVMQADALSRTLTANSKANFGAK